MEPVFMAFRLLSTLANFTILSVSALSLTSCGGGGGGSGDSSSDPHYPGYTELKVERDSLDSGDLTDVTLTVHDINQFGVFVKFHYPNSLRYENKSAMTFIGDGSAWVAATPFASVSNEAGKYLVFKVDRPSNNQTNRVAIGFTMRALAGDPSAYVEVDLDNNDPMVPDNQEFNPQDPQFTAVDKWNIAINGAPAATPTPAQTGSATPAATPASTPTPKTGA